jgi:hypothetical protein
MIFKKISITRGSICLPEISWIQLNVFLDSRLYDKEDNNASHTSMIAKIRTSSGITSSFLTRRDNRYRTDSTLDEVIEEAHHLPE